MFGIFLGYTHPYPCSATTEECSKTVLWTFISLLVVHNSAGGRGSDFGFGRAFLLEPCGPNFYFWPPFFPMRWIIQMIWSHELRYQTYLNLQKARGMKKRGECNIVKGKGGKGEWCKIIERKKGEEWCIGRGGGVRFQWMAHIVAKSIHTLAKETLHPLIKICTSSRLGREYVFHFFPDTLQFRPIHGVPPYAKGVTGCPLSTCQGLQTESFCKCSGTLCICICILF